MRSKRKIYYIFYCGDCVANAQANQMKFDDYWLIIDQRSWIDKIRDWIIEFRSDVNNERFGQRVFVISLDYIDAIEYLEKYNWKVVWHRRTEKHV